MKFSVLLSVYYKEKPSYLDQSLRSIWDDQKVKPDQIVLVKDGFLPDALNILIDEWKDKLGSVFNVVELPKNMGLASALNVGLKSCNYELVARMDTDDVSLPNRFEDQVAFMTDNPSISVCSGLVEEWDEALEDKINIRILPCQHEEILAFAKKRNPISHPASIFRKSDVISVGGYSPVYPEDYDLWIKMIHYGYRFANVSKVVLKMRTGDDFYSRRGRGFFKGEVRIMKMQLDYGMIGLPEFMVNSLARMVLRLSPTAFKKMAYKLFR